MRKFLATIFALPLLFIGCTTDTAGTTEETNAINAVAMLDGDLDKWAVIEGNAIELDKQNQKALAGRVTLGKPSADGLARAGLEFDVSEEGKPANLLDLSEGLCIAYQSDFEVEVQLDMGDFVNDAVDEDYPSVSMHKTISGVETHCHRWSSFRTKHSDLMGEVAAMTVRAVRLMFAGESGETGNFSINRVGKYEDNSDFSSSSSEEPQSSSSVESSSSSEAISSSSEKISSSSEELSSSSVEEINDAESGYAVLKYGSATDITPSTTSQYKADSSFLWEGSEEMSVVDLGNQLGELSGYWTVSLGSLNIMSLPDSVEENSYGDIIVPWLQNSKGFKGTIKAEEGRSGTNPYIGFNVAGENLLADISSWGGLCIRYKSTMSLDVAITGDVSHPNDYWYVTLMSSSEMVWAKIGWDVFRYKGESDSGIESALGVISQLRIMFPEEGEFFIDAVGSYDQCGE